MTDQEQALTFTGFVFSLMHTAAVHLGDAADPVSGQTQVPNIEGARQMIDILGILEEKTRGNLTVEERQLLEQGLYELRMRFVDVKDGGPRIIVP
jgi:hypothetical protein